MRKRAGLFLIASGIALAGLTAILVFGIARQATAASRATIRQVAVVVTTHDLVDQTQITADALEVKPFPADFAPPGAFSTVDDLVGKYAQGFIPRGQVIVAGQIQLARPAPDLSDRIEPGFVVVWLPMPDVLVNSTALKPGDHVDVLLTAPMTMDAGGGKQSESLSTQTTLQNVQIYRIGDDEVNVAAPARTDGNGNSNQSSNGAVGSSPVANVRKPVGLLVDHQNAVMLKFVKDAGGTIDLVTRSAADQQVVRTDGVTLDTLADRFQFRIPQSIQRSDAAKKSS